LYKTIEKQDVFRERAMDGDSAFYTSLLTPFLPGTMLRFTINGNTCV
jgi:hypothetical protein